MNNFNRIGKIFWLLIFMLSIFSTACKRENDTLKIPFDGEVELRHPRKVSGQDWGLVLNQVFEGLFTFSPSGRLKAQLVKSWWHDKNATVFRFKIKHGVEFHDGSVMDIRDVEYSINWHIKNMPDTNAAYMLDSIKSVKVLDKEQIEIRTKESEPTLLYFLGGPTVKIVPKGLFENDFRDLKKYWVGTGAYSLKQVNEKAITIEYYKGYREPANIKRVFFNETRNSESDFLKGSLDFAHIPRSKVAEYKKSKKFYVLSYPMLGVFYIGFNLSHPKFRNIWLRRAISNAIDRTKLLENYENRLSTVPSGFIPYGLNGFRKRDGSLNLELAKSQLAKVPKNQLPTAKDMVVIVPSKIHPMLLYALQRIKKDLGKLDFNVLLEKIGLLLQ